MKYAEIDKNGVPVAFYADDIHDTIPQNAIEIPEADWEAHINDDLRRWDGTAWIPYTPPPYTPTIQEQITALEMSITPRNLRAAALGDTFALNKIKQVEREIAVLRSKL